MNLITAAKGTLKDMDPESWHYEHVTSATLEAEITSGDDAVADEADSFEHVTWMLEGIAKGYIKGEKGNRWLGWAQAVIHIHQEGMDLETFKEINRGE